MKLVTVYLFVNKIKKWQEKFFNTTYAFLTNIYIG